MTLRTGGSPQRLRAVLVLVVALGLVALAVRWSAGRRGFATPADCLEAYGAACLAGDVAGYLSCLGEPLRSETRQCFADDQELAEWLRQTMKDVKSWTQLLAPVAGSGAEVDVDEVRASGTRRLRFHLEHSGQGWLIVGIEQPRAVPTAVPYGTHISKVPEGPPPK